MFRTHNHRGRQRFLELRRAKMSSKIVKSLNGGQIELLEHSDCLSLGEKIEVLCISGGYKLTTEVFSQIDYEFDKNKKEVPTESSLSSIQEVIEALPYPSFIDRVERLNRDSNNQQQLTWYQVAANQATLTFLQSYSDDLTEYEEGIIYGYPISAIQAFAGLIEECSLTPKTPWSHYLGGVFSRKYVKQEDEYYRQVWTSLRQISPRIIGEAEQTFNQ